MLTATPKVGDRLIAVPIRYRTHEKLPQEVTVSKVGRKYITVAIFHREDRFDSKGHGESYELWDSQETYDRHLQRDRNITKIKKAVSVYNFGDGLSDEDLEQICKLIEAK